MRVALIESRSRTRDELLTMFAESNIDAQPVAALSGLGPTLDAGVHSVMVVGEPDGVAKIDVIRRIREHPGSAGLVVIGIIAGVDGSESTALFEAGADDVFALPITTQDLSEVIQRATWENVRELEPSDLKNRLAKPARLLMNFVDQASDGYFIAAEDGEIVAASAGLSRLTGFDRNELVGETIAGLGLSPTSIDSNPDDAGKPRTMSMTIVTSDWKEISVQVELFDIRLVSVRCQFGILREAAETPAVDVRRLNQIIQKIVRQSNDAMLIVDPSGCFQHVSHGFEQIFGWTQDALVGRTLLDYVSPEDYSVIQPLSSASAAPSGILEGVRFLQESGGYRTINLKITELDQGQQHAGWIVAISATASTVLRQTRRLDGGGYYSLYDPVTALPNRLLFIDRLDHAIERTARINSVMCCLVVSIDNAEADLAGLGTADVNQVFGEYARRLHQSMREGDTVARVGDTDFAVLAEGVGGAAEARMIGDRLVDALDSPFATESGTIILRSSVGAAISSPSGQNAGNLLRDATSAMEYSRNVGGGRSTIYEYSMRKNVVDSLRIEGDIDGLHERGELQVFYQPEVDIHDDVVIGAEALVRWEHPRHGLILPGEFLSLAEEAGLLDEIGLWIIETVCETVQDWRSKHPSAEGMVGVVNLTPGQIESRGFVDEIASILDRTGLPAANLRLEISETELSGIERWRRVAEDLRSLGLKVGLQDLNPATLSVDDLELLPVDTIKIDRTAMNTTIQNPARPSLSLSTARIEPIHGIKVVVASIETAQHLARARIHGYQRGQGFYFYRPVPAQTVEYLLLRKPREVPVATALDAAPATA